MAVQQRTPVELEEPGPPAIECQRGAFKFRLGILNLAAQAFQDAARRCERRRDRGIEGNSGQFSAPRHADPAKVPT